MCFIATCHELGQKHGVLGLLRRDALALCEEAAEASQDVLAGAGDAGVMFLSRSDRPTVTTARLVHSHQSSRSCGRRGKASHQGPCALRPSPKRMVCLRPRS
jgi:hypothetical protein